MEGKTTVSKSKKGDIMVRIPLSSFIREHKDLANILESGVQEAILNEAMAQRQELDDIIKKVNAIKDMKGSKPKMEEPKAEMPEPKPKMEEPKPKAEMPETKKFKEMMEARRKPMASMAPDLRTIAPKK